MQSRLDQTSPMGQIAAARARPTIMSWAIAWLKYGSQFLLDIITWWHILFSTLTLQVTYFLNLGTRVGMPPPPQAIVHLQINGPLLRVIVWLWDRDILHVYIALTQFTASDREVLGKNSKFLNLRQQTSECLIPKSYRSLTLCALETACRLARLTPSWMAS